MTAGQQICGSASRDAVNAPVEQRVATASSEQVEAGPQRVRSAATLAEAIAD